MDSTNLGYIKANIKSGKEELTYLKKSVGYSLLDFWKWSVSDIISNATRGRLAEFIVGTAIDIDINNLRDEWDAYDLITKEGIKIEIKSAAYIQSWKQKKYSTISFSIKPASHSDNKDSMVRTVVKRHADIYIFCLLKHTDQQTINPLQLEQWEFYILPTYKLNQYTRSKSSITLKSLQKLTSAIEYLELNHNILNVYQNPQRVVL